MDLGNDAMFMLLRLSREEAKKKIYRIVCENHFVGFGAEIEAEISNKLKGRGFFLYICIVFFDGDDGTVETWPEDQRKFNGVIQKYKRVGRIEREKNCVDLDSQLEARKKKLEDSCGWDQRLDDLSKESLSELGCLLDCQLEKVRERVHQLNNVSHENSNSVLVDEAHPPYFGDNSVMIGSPSYFHNCTIQLNKSYLC
ncbi:hypothetical protein IFM89_020344 [Coptis chinensis]|uniref:Uncharacterized protein n=1 Tax=Coptis chinensis TaxID=261450 RepID=A0A835H6S4_9MAGN|nr:hypothetical protein IFM89_020344 [Coptis chinensis]